jgi:hypothetical protein
VRYPPRFKALTIAVVAVSAAWVVNYLSAVLPAIEEHGDAKCEYNAKMLFVYFVWFALARASLFLPCVATRVAFVQSRTHGFCRTYCVHLVIRDGPLYIFVVGSLLFWFHLLQSPSCRERSRELYQALKLYAINSCVLSAVCLLFSYWHNKLLAEATRSFRFEAEDQRAPPDTINQLETVVFAEHLFGDEEGKLYPAECAICLARFERQDVIKATQCNHAFHEECLANWLTHARTCALCRQDLTKRVPTRIGAAEPEETPEPMRRSGPAPMAAPAAATPRLPADSAGAGSGATGRASVVSVRVASPGARIAAADRRTSQGRSDSIGTPGFRM